MSYNPYLNPFMNAPAKGMLYEAYQRADADQKAAMFNGLLVTLTDEQATAVHSNFAFGQAADAFIEFVGRLFAKKEKPSI